MKQKILKKFNISRRTFNKFIIFNFVIILSNNFFQKKKLKVKKINFNNYVWLLNEND